ncbi:MAG: hypothetical protein HYX24_02340 [Candidatus Aenigmarchaeota archaeon]|nr:hypothetical protein [Candidatus Aenigmarchaeota archaeon]
METFLNKGGEKAGIEIADKRLFLRYAIPCTSTLVKRGTVKKELVNELLDYALRKREMQTDIRETFPVAYLACRKIAQNRGKGEIGPEEIREYFWNLHDDVIERRFEEKRDFDKDDCRIWAGKVLRLLEDNRAEVLTQRRERIFRNAFEPHLKKDDYVVTHYDFITEKVSRENAKAIWEDKNRRLGIGTTFP